MKYIYVKLFQTVLFFVAKTCFNRPSKKKKSLLIGKHTADLRFTTAYGKCSRQVVQRLHHIWQRALKLQ